MEIILILIAFFVVWRVLISLAKSSDAYIEFVVNGIKPEIDKLIQNQPIALKYVQNLNSLQQWKKFSSENYLKKRFEEDKQLQESIKNRIPIFKENIAYYQSSYDRILSEFRLKKPQLKWYVSFQIEKDIKQSQQRFRDSNFNNMFDIEWSYTSPQGRNSYESRSKFTLYQVSQVLSQLEENKASKGGVKYQESQITKSSSNDRLTITKSGSFNNYKDNSIIDVTEQSTKINSNYRMIKYSSGVPKWADKYIYSFSEITKATYEQKKFYDFYKKSFTNGDIVFLEGNTNYAFILMFDFQNEYEKDKNLPKLETRFKKLEECYPATKPYGISILNKERETVSSSRKLNTYSNEEYSKLGSKNEDNSIIDVTGQSTKINSKGVLVKYILGVPEWKNQYVYSFSEINQASDNQKGFYNIFKNSFLNGIYYDLYKNTNYAFILINDFKNEYEEDKNLLKLETQLKTIGEIYPDTKPYGGLILKQKKEEVNISTSNNINVYPNNNYYEEYWKLGSKYKDKLKLNEEEVKLLNNIYNPSNNFFNIEYCGIEILKLYIAVISALKTKYIKEETTIEEQFLAVADVVARKQFRYRNGSENYKYCIETRPNEFYSHIFKCCENAVREFYDHKRKLNTDNYYSNLEAKTEFETKILSKTTELLPILISKVSQPDEATEIELYTQNTSRWKIKFEQLTTNYNDKPQEFIDSILTLGKLNKKNPSIENIFFEASKFIAKYDNESAVSLYIHYLYQDLKSTSFDNKQHTKTIQKSLFKTNEQLHNFEAIVSELIKDKDLEKALKQIPEIYKIKRKKIQFNTASINEIQKKHSETVELLNEYLKDDFEEVNNTIIDKELEKSTKPAPKEDVKLNSQLPFRWRDKFDESKADFEKQSKKIESEKISNNEVQQNPEIKRKKIQFNTASINEIQKKHSETVELLNEYLKDDFEEDNNSIKSQGISKEEVHQSAFVSELTFTAIHTTALELFAKSNFSISQDEFEEFAKSKGVFKNQLIESINDTCYEFLDDVLIEEEEDYYTINTNYFQRISTK